MAPGARNSPGSLNGFSRQTGAGRVRCASAARSRSMSRNALASAAVLNARGATAARTGRVSRATCPQERASRRRCATTHCSCIFINNARLQRSRDGDTRGNPDGPSPSRDRMKFTFKIFQTNGGRLELFLEPSSLDLPSTDAAHRLAKHYALYVPVRLITIETEDGSISELWSGDSQDIALAADQSRSRGQRLSSPAIAMRNAVRFDPWQ